MSVLAGLYASEVAVPAIRLLRDVLSLNGMPVQQALSASALAALFAVVDSSAFALPARKDALGLFGVLAGSKDWAKKQAVLDERGLVDSLCGLAVAADSPVQNEAGAVLAACLSHATLLQGDDLRAHGVVQALASVVGRAGVSVELSSVVLSSVTRVLALCDQQYGGDATPVLQHVWDAGVGGALKALAGHASPVVKTRAGVTSRAFAAAGVIVDSGGGGGKGGNTEEDDAACVLRLYDALTSADGDVFAPAARELGGVFLTSPSLIPAAEAAFPLLLSAASAVEPASRRASLLALSHAALWGGAATVNILVQAGVLGVLSGVLQEAGATLPDKLLCVTTIDSLLRGGAGQFGQDSRGAKVCVEVAVADGVPASLAVVVSTLVGVGGQPGQGWAAPGAYRAAMAAATGLQGERKVLGGVVAELTMKWFCGLAGVGAHRTRRQRCARANAHPAHLSFPAGTGKAYRALRQPGEDAGRAWYYKHVCGRLLTLVQPRA